MQTTNKTKKKKIIGKTMAEKETRTCELFVIWVNPRGHHRARSDRGQSSSLAAAGSHGSQGRLFHPNKARHLPANPPREGGGGGGGADVGEATPAAAAPPGGSLG
ncbi:hypothetical protein ABZP36_034592 [Zizania latifolia]